MNLLIPLAAILAIISIGILAYVKRMMVTTYLLTANIVAFIISLSDQGAVFNSLGFRPSYISTAGIPYLYTLLTSMFVHYDIFHLLGNMITLFFLGIAFERRVGVKVFLTLYLITGICGDVVFSMIYRNSDCILIGASGAIFGILGAFAATYPRDEILMPIPVGIMLITRVKVFTAAVIFTILQFAFLYLSSYSNVAYMAHLGGLASGLVLGMALIREKRIRVKVEIPKKDLPLEKVARNKKLRQIVELVRKEEIPEVRNSWLDKLAEEANCPNCKGKLRRVGESLKCTECGLVLR